MRKLAPKSSKSPKFEALLRPRLPTMVPIGVFRPAPWHRAVVRAVRPRILIPRARRLSTYISRGTASFVGLPCAVVALRGRKRGHFGEKVVENGVFRFFVFYTTFSPKWPRLCPRSATTAQVRPTKLAVARDMHVDRRRARGIRIRSRTERTTARCQGAGRNQKNPAGRLERTGYYF